MGQLELKEKWLRGPWALSVAGVLVSLLERKYVWAWDILRCLASVSLGAVAGAIVGIVQGCPSMHCPGATLVEQLEVGWAQARGLPCGNAQISVN